MIYRILKIALLVIVFFAVLVFFINFIMLQSIMNSENTLYIDLGKNPTIKKKEPSFNKFILNCTDENNKFLCEIQNDSNCNKIEKITVWKKLTNHCIFLSNEQEFGYSLNGNNCLELIANNIYTNPNSLSFFNTQNDVFIVKRLTYNRLLLGDIAKQEIKNVYFRPDRIEIILMNNQVYIFNENGNEIRLFFRSNTYSISEILDNLDLRNCNH